MISQEFQVMRYDADEGKVFDWKRLSEHITHDNEGVEYVNHLYAKTLFIGEYDSIDNYVEVEKE